MKTKSRDTKYCGCNIDNINSISINDIDLYNLRIFYYFICERYKIYKRRFIEKSDYPWTNDIILRSYRFTNIFREYDKNTKWLIDNISNNRDLSYSERIYRTILYRMYSNMKTAQVIELDNLNFDWSIKDISSIYYKLKDLKEDVYTRAFKTVGLKYNLSKLYGAYNYRLYPLLYVRDIREKYGEDIVDIINNTNNQNDIFKMISKIPGSGRFLSYQIFVDLTYINEFPYSENEFVICGPGCIKGMKYIFNKDITSSSEEKLFWLRDNIDDLFSGIDDSYDPNILFDNREEYDRCLNIMSLQNCFCEFSKYMYSYTGVGAPKRKYPDNK